MMCYWQERVSCHEIKNRLSELGVDDERRD